MSSAAGIEAIRGQVEQFHLELGVEGWAVNNAEPGTPVVIEIFAGADRVGEGVADRLREDVGQALNVSPNAGFRFDSAALSELRTLVNGGWLGKIEVRAVGADVPLFEVDSEAVQTSQGLEPEAVSGIEYDLLARLGMLRGDASRSRSRALRPVSENSRGFIESFAIDEGGLVWVVGWMRRDALADRPVVILDQIKTPAGFAYALIPREDLPSDATGFIGVLRTEWRPSPTSRPFFFISGDDQTYLETLMPINVLTKPALIEHCRDRWVAAQAGHATALVRLLQHAESWTPLPEHFVAERAAIEEVLFLANFGAFVTGWAVSPTKEVDRLLIRLGGNVLMADPGATVRQARPDLDNIYPGADQMLETAGFTAVFPGALDEGLLADAMLKILYRDGTSSNHPIPPGKVRKLGAAASLERMLRLFPSVAAEPFFPRLANAVRQMYAARAAVIRPLVPTQTDKALVFAVASSRSDIFLLFDRIVKEAERLPSDYGIVLLAEQDANRGATVQLVNAIRKRLNRPCGLYFVEDVSAAAYALPALLEAVGARTFLFVGAHIALNQTGWDAATRLNDRLTFLEVSDPAIPEDPNRGPSFDCFAWSSAGWSGWLAEQPFLLGGAGAVPPSERLVAGARQVPVAADRSHLFAPTPFVTAVNQAGALS